MRSLPLFAGAVVLAAQLGTAQTISPREAARFLDQATWGPTPASVAELQNAGIANWLAAQFALRSSDLPDQPILNPAGKPNNNLAPIQAAFFQNAVSAQDQLRQRVAFTLSEIWVVSATSGAAQAYAYPPYWRLLHDHAFGNYRDIIKAVTLSPLMGRYLNMANNNKANPSKGTAANENYARELMQLFTLGLTQLNMNGTPVVDANGSPVPTYDQNVVTNVAKMLTGWTFPTERDVKPKVNNPTYYIGQMFPVASEHDTSSKTIFSNITIPANQTAEQDLESLLDALMAHPTMAPFVSQQLIQHLVTSNPSPAYVQRVAQVFQNDGSGVAGNMQAVITAILTDPEARAGDPSPSAITPTFGHLREPILFMANVLRGLNATLAETNSVSASATNMGEQLFYAPSVFSFFSPQYPTEQGLLGPEFQIYSTQTATQRANIVNTLLYGTLGGVKTNLTPYTAVAVTTSALLDYIAQVFLRGSMSTQLQNAATDAINAATTPTAKVQAALYIVLTSAEYQIVQ